MKHLLVLVSFLAAAGVASAQTAVTIPSTTTLGTGFDYSRGDYGFASDTEVSSVPLNLVHERGPWLLSASFSWLTVKGPATIVGGGKPALPAGIRADLELLDEHRFDNGVVRLRYRIPT